MLIVHSVLHVCAKKFSFVHEVVLHHQVSQRDAHWLHYFFINPCYIWHALGKIFRHHYILLELVLTQITSTVLIIDAALVEALFVDRPKDLSIDSFSFKLVVK